MGRNGHLDAHRHSHDAESLRRCAWEIGEHRLAEAYSPPGCYVGLAVVSPQEGFAHWSITDEWVEQTVRSRGSAWESCRLVVRLYDVTYLEFNGLNAHQLHDLALPALTGHRFFPVPKRGTWQLAEVGFLLRNGEFVPAARSQAVAFPPVTPSNQSNNEALLVDKQGRREAIDNLWEKDRILAERRRPHLRQSLRVAAFAFASVASGQEGSLARFVSELAAGQCAQGHDVHVFVPASAALTGDRNVEGVTYHALNLDPAECPLDLAWSFAQAAQARLSDMPPFDLTHLHEWMTAQGPYHGGGPTVLSLSSLEVTRRDSTPADAASLAIEEAERKAAQSADRLLTPPWLRDRALAELGLEAPCVAAFPMEGRLPNEWDCPLDFGQVKMNIGVGPLDRLILFVGPLDHIAGVDLLVEALPVLLQRWQNLRIAFVGAGPLHDALHHRSHHLGVAHAVRLLGHMEGPQLTQVLRSSMALILPSRYRVPFDDAVVELARRAGRPVVTTNGGPAHLVRHEETGIITYDNPGSMVWAVDRILGDPGNAERMGSNGRRSEDGAIVWSDVARHYLELCAGWFPELSETHC